MIIVTFHRETREITVNFTSDEGPHGSTGFLQLVEADKPWDPNDIPF